MSKHRSLWGAGCIVLALAVSTGCSDEAKQNSPGAGNTAVTAQPSAAATAAAGSTTPAVTAAASPTATTAPAAKSVKLIPEVLEYSESGIDYVLDGVNIPTAFSADQTLPLGVFLPETMIRFELDGRTAWGTADKQSYLTFVKLGTAEEAAGDGQLEPGTDPNLLKYKEYAGSKQEGDQHVEAFVFQAKDTAYRAEIHIQEQQMDALLPLFLSMVSNVESFVKPPPIQSGIFFKAPDVGNSPGNKQALRETMACIEAWSARDQEKFAATMINQNLEDALQFLLDEKNSYRFNELTVVGIPIEGTKRAGFYISFTRMTSEGYIREGTYEISLLRNKQGEWKIANID
ncbi:hypothetical protein [Paenibacillus piscarius]|uniref:hypothetical protein n=1 Tax=Paenibacillus piscarius TaxID=1089681 RepID=UPI001EE98107|nr:hypothetical protein [Paenibacillus piscarius]